MLVIVILFASLAILSSYYALFANGSTQNSSSTSGNNTVLEKALKSLEENQKGTSSVPPIPFANQSSTDSIQEASKITKLSGSTSKYENTDYGISITFPSNWTPSEVSLPQHGIVNFIAPEAIDKTTPLIDYVYTPASLLVASQKLPVLNMALPEFIKHFIKDRYLNATDYRIISSSNSNLGGLESGKIMMYEYDDVGSLKLMRNIAVDHKNNIAYMIKYSADPGMFSKYLPIAEQMSKSFQLTK